MKKTLLFLMMLVPGFLIAQSAANSQLAKVDAFVPKTLSAGTSMSARAISTTYDDTTKSFQVRGWARVYIGLETATNDSMRILVSYQPSKDGVTFDALVVLDSLSNTGTVGKLKYIQLPANAMGSHSVRVRVYGDADLARYSSNPSTTLTTKIIRSPF